MSLREDELTERLAIAEAVLHEAGALALDYFRRRHELAIQFKGPQDVVSHADREVERLIRERLSAAFPGDGFLGEEHGAEGDQSRCWVIDPIDGTQNFLRGIPYWTVVLAFVVDGQTELGLTADPLHDESWVAWRGRGARRNGGEIACRRPEHPGEACVALSFGFKDDWRQYVDMQARFLERGVDMRRLGSTALILAHIADGRLDVLYAPGNQSWDCLAGLLLVAEAGGAVGNFLSAYGLTGRGPTVASVRSMRGLVSELTGLELL